MQVLIGFFIGFEIEDESEYFYKESLWHGHILLEVLMDASHAPSAWHLLTQVNPGSWAEHPFADSKL